jgi:general secretion pathway protein G
MARNQKGMTLVEIMVVLAIIGGLIGILAGQVQKQFKKAKVKEARIQMAEIGKALDIYLTDCGSYPTSEQGLGALLEAPPDCKNWGPDAYIKKMPTDPWGTPFVYEMHGNNYTLKSLGDDKREGGTGTAADISSDDN